MSKTVKIGIACAIGAFIGALISSDLATRFEFGQYLWIVGTVIGGLIGYFSYEIKEVGRAIKRAWVSTTTIDWQQTIVSIRYCITNVCMAVLVVGTALLIVCGTACSWGIVAYLLVLHASLDVVVLVIVMAMIVGISCGMGALIWWVDERVDSWMEGVPIILKWTPFGLLYLLYLLAKVSPRLASWSWQFSKSVFIQIHSNERLLCGVDAAIGATIGYFAGSAIVGALAGAVFGIGNYEIISVRALKLIPIPTQK